MRALVAGAGIGGLATAWWLAEHGWDVVVAERHPVPRTAGYVIDFFGPGWTVAERMGLVPALRAARVEVDRIEYVDPRGRSLGAAGYKTFGAAVGDRVVSIGRGDLAAVLLEATRERAELRWGAGVVGADDGGRLVQLADGTTEEVDLLVGADGLHSTVRDAVVAPGADVLRPLGYRTAAFRLEGDTVRRRLGRRARLVAVPGRQVALYPTADGVAVWFVRASDDPAPDDPAEALRRDYRGMGDAVDGALARIDDAQDLYEDVVAQVVTPSWASGRAVLVGDACQAPSLMAGQGASMAVTGAWTLAQHLRGAGDVPSGIDGYVRAMRPFAEERQATGRTTTRWLLPDSWWRIRVRQAAIGLARMPGSGPLVRTVFRTSAEPELPPVPPA